MLARSVPAVPVSAQTLSVVFEEVAVDQITFDEPLGEAGSIEVQEFEEPPAEVEKFFGAANVAKTFEITVPEGTEDTAATIRVTISKDELGGTPQRMRLLVG